MQFSLMIIYSS